jgi:hypothetical protein
MSGRAIKASSTMGYLSLDSDNLRSSALRRGQIALSPLASYGVPRAISCTVAATVRSSAEPTATAAMIWRSEGGAAASS